MRNFYRASISLLIVDSRLKCRCTVPLLNPAGERNLGRRDIPYNGTCGNDDVYHISLSSIKKVYIKIPCELCLPAVSPLVPLSGFRLTSGIPRSGTECSADKLWQAGVLCGVNQLLLKQ